MSEIQQREVRPIFRRLAAGVAVLCFLFAIAAAIFMDEDSRFVGAAIFVFIGFVMGTIAFKGSWPARR